MLNELEIEILMSVSGAQSFLARGCSRSDRSIEESQLSDVKPLQGTAMI